MATTAAEALCDDGEAMLWGGGQAVSRLDVFFRYVVVGVLLPPCAMFLLHSLVRLSKVAVACVVSQTRAC